MKKDYFNGKTEDDKKIIHLFITSNCTHHCKLCCNNEYGVDEIPVVSVPELKSAEVICLTGGEPFLIPGICDLAKSVKAQFGPKQIYVYTCGDSLYQWLSKYGTLHDIDGVNISPKNRFDAECVTKIFKLPDYRNQILSMWSNRIYLFPNVRNQISTEDFWGYENVEVINREWQEDFEPDSGIFRRLPVLF